MLVSFSSLVIVFKSLLKQWYMPVSPSEAALGIVAGGYRGRVTAVDDEDRQAGT